MLRGPAGTRSRTIAIVVVILILGAGLVAVRLMSGALRPQAVRDALTSLGAGTPLEAFPIAPLALIIILAAILVVPILPAIVFQVGSGLAFGPAWGLVYTLAADVLGAAAGYLLAQRWGARLLHRWLSPATARAVERMATRLTWKGIILLRLLPGPAYPLVSFAAGLSGLSLGRYLLASFLGVLPSLILLVISGDIATRAPLVGVLIVVVFVGSLTLVGHLLRRTANTSKVEG